MNTFLFLFSVSPVQSFIEAARKTQDLYAGSQMLSEITEQAIKFLKNKTNLKDDEIIFPHPDIETMPNRLLAKVETDDPEKLGNDLENYIKDYIKSEAETKLPKRLDGEHPTGAIEQIQDFFEFNWNFIEYKETTYQDDYKTLEKEHGAIKNSRLFTQFSEQGRKCALDGRYNVKYYRLSYRENQKLKKEKFKDKKSVYFETLKEKLFLKRNQEVRILNYFDKERSLTHKNLQPGEGLSALSFFKRQYLEGRKDKNPFPSTAEIALMQQIYDTKISCNVFNYLNQFRDKYPNFQLLYEENLTEDYFKKNGYSKLIGKLAFIQKERKALEDNIKEANGCNQLHKYYAVIMFDGDSMGKVFGEKSEDFHKELSKLLGKFANDIGKDYLKEPKGRVVYAGGEDFLAFVNLVHLFDVMKELRQRFKKEVSKKIKEEFPDAIQDEITFSAGVVIAHYKIPLSLVLSQVRAAEKKAKGVDGKNAFAISVLKHSGEIQTTYWKWYSSNDQLLISNCEIILKSLLNKEFSNTFIKAIHVIFEKLLNYNGSLLSTEHHLVSSELERLLYRSCMEKDDIKKKKSEVVESLLKQIQPFLDGIINNDFINFFSLLHVIDFMYRELKYE